MRTFVAIGLPQSLLTELDRHQTAFRSSLRGSPGAGNDTRWARREGIHLTLKFLGEINEAMVSRAVTELTALQEFPHFTVEVRGFGFFPDSRRPRVFWAGLAAPDALHQLAREIEKAMARLGFPPEDRCFSPHLTLARFRDSRPQPAIGAMAEKVRDLTIGQFVVSEFALFESKLAAGSPAEYRTVASFPLSGRSAL